MFTISVKQALLVGGSCLLLACLAPFALGEQPMDVNPLSGLGWRNIGPAVMGGRISDVAGVSGDVTTVYAAAGSGGLFRTQDGGMTWDSIFDRESTISIGAIAVQADDPKVIWVGTGESNVRNSVSFGDGVYKSVDAGATWTKMGLENTETISRIVINPRNPDNVFVAAVGHPFGPNAERGVFVTEDGGRTWKKTLYLDQNHGASDLELDPSDPQIVYAGMWRFERKPWTYTSGSEQGGVFRSKDGGHTWQKLTAGLPKLMGRIGVKVAPSAPNVVYVIVESKDGTLYRSDDRGSTFTKISSDRELVGRGYYFSDLRVSPESDNHLLVLADGLLESMDGGAHFSRMASSIHGDLQAVWIDPKDPRRIWQGNDGGLAVTYDGGHHWQQINNIPLAQCYDVSADTMRPFYRVIVGMQDTGSWTGPSRTREPAGIFNDDWRMLNQFVGFHSLSDLDNPDLVLTEQPGGALVLNNLKTREQQVVSPQPRSFAGAPAADMKYRFNWDAPLVRSPFGKRTIYLAGNVVFQSSDYGRSWEAISRDLTKNETSRMGNVGGPISTDNSASEVYSTVTALAESSAKRGVLWAGTDDGNLQVTTNGGGEWKEVSGKLPGVARDSPVSHVEPSMASPETAYVTLDRHMFDDFRPYIFKTTDAGESWADISAGLPSKAFVWTVREDPRRAGLLYAGTELGLYARWPGATQWAPLHLKNMPWSIAVRDIQFQKASNDILVATHGRGVWILDDASVLEDLADVESKPVALLPMRPALRFTERATRYGFGDQTFTAPNPAYGALITCYLRSKADTLSLEILDETGKVVRTLAASGKPGLQRVTWDLRYAVPGAQRRGAKGVQALPGRYTVRLTADGKTTEEALSIELDPELSATPADLRKQFEMSSGILQMEAKLEGDLSNLEALRSKFPSEASTLIAQLGRPAKEGRSGGPPELRENLQSLFSMIDEANAAPTEAQVRYYDDLRARCDEADAKVEALLKTPSEAKSEGQTR